MRSCTLTAASSRRLETARLILRHPAMSDLDRFFAIDGDPQTHLHNPAGPDTDVETSERRLRSFIEDWKRCGIGYWTVRLKPRDEVIGFAGLRRMEWRGRDVLNLYYRFTPDAWGRGYATEVSTAALEVARKYFPGVPVVARARPTNAAAIAVAVKVGLRRRPDLDGELVALVSQ